MNAWWLLVFPAELIMIFVIAYTVLNYPRNDRPLRDVPQGWKIKRRGFLGLRGFDAQDPEGRWLGWAYRRKSWAVDHAWDVTKFELMIKSYEARPPGPSAAFRRLLSDRRSSPITPPSDGSGSEPGDGNA